jgi:hypothetical protein
MACTVINPDVNQVEATYKSLGMLFGMPSFLDTQRDDPNFFGATLGRMNFIQDSFINNV